MLKKFLTFLLILFLAGQARGMSINLESRVGWFSPAARDFRDAYNGGITYGAGLSFELISGLSLWTGIDLFSKTGKLTFTEEETNIRITSLFAGLKTVLSQAVVRPYFAAALTYSMYKEESVIGSVNGGDPGFSGQAGVHWRLAPRLFLDLFARYGRCRAQPDDPEAVEPQIGGFTGGAGLMFKF